VKLARCHQVSFNKSEKTNYQELKLKLKLKPGEVVCFYSRSENQVAFVWRPVVLKVESEVRGKPVMIQQTVYPSMRLRLEEHETWSIYMLREYGRRAGIEISNIQLFEQHLRRIQREKARLRAERAREMAHAA
jgi:hypothetical protein